LGAVAAVLKLFALDLLLMALLMGLVAAAAAVGFKAPESAIDKITLGPVWLAVIVLFAPAIEETVFRSWLSGRAGHIGAVVLLIAAVTLAALSGPQAFPILALGSLVIGLVLAVALVVWLRKRPPLPFFSRHFPWFYFASALVFAGMHVFNYGQGAALALLPLVVPQLLVGLILGYSRVTYGLWSDIALHMAHNGLLIGLVVLQKGGI